MHAWRVAEVLCCTGRPTVRIGVRLLLQRLSQSKSQLPVAFLQFFLQVPFLAALPRKGKEG